MVRSADISTTRFIVELGPGTGSFTGRIAASLPKGARFAAIERDPGLARDVAGRFPGVHVIEGCATEISRHLQEASLPAPDTILSGLPWAAFPEPLQSRILSEIQATLNDGGTFATFAYYGPHRLKAGRRFREKLNSVFSSVEKSRVVLGNFPPAFVYRCKR
jgi:phospholipid N-methyltransferase